MLSPDRSPVVAVKSRPQDRLLRLLAIPSSALPPCPDRALRLLASPQGRQAAVLENEPGIQEVLSAAYADLQDVRKCSVSRERFANSSFATLLTSIASTTAVTAASLGVIVGAAWVEWKSPWMGTAVSWGAFLGIHVFLLSQFRRLVARGRSTSLAYGVGRSELSSYRGVAALEVAAGALECSRSISESSTDSDRRRAAKLLELGKGDLQKVIDEVIGLVRVTKRGGMALIDAEVLIDEELARITAPSPIAESRVSSGKIHKLVIEGVHAIMFSQRKKYQKVENFIASPS